MAIHTTIGDDIKDAMRSRDKVRLGALRQIRAAFIVEQKKTGVEGLDDAACVAVLRRLAKQRGDSIAAFEAAGRDDLRDIEVAELSVIDLYLPQLADEATTSAWVAAAIAESGASGPGDMGKVMGALMRAHKGDIDGGMAKRLVLAALNS
jgi:uncharacterized protein YqeY